MFRSGPRNAHLEVTPPAWVTGTYWETGGLVQCLSHGLTYAPSQFYESSWRQPKSIGRREEGMFIASTWVQFPGTAVLTLTLTQKFCLVHPLHFLSWKRFDDPTSENFQICLQPVYPHQHLRGVPSKYIFHKGWYSYEYGSFKWLRMLWDTAMVSCHAGAWQPILGCLVKAHDFILLWESSPKMYFSTLSARIEYRKFSHLLKTLIFMIFMLLNQYRNSMTG